MTRSQMKLLALLALFAAPILAAWLAASYWTPQRLANYGELLPPKPLRLPVLTAPGGQTRAWAELRGKWVLLVVAPAGCDADCSHAAWLARQVRLAQGRERDRIERVFLSTQAEMNWPYGNEVYRAVLAQPSEALARGGLFLVDPMGNLMLRFPQHADGERVIRDLHRLLQASQRS